jgi:hypothetical protein
VLQLQPLQSRYISICPSYLPSCSAMWRVWKYFVVRFVQCVCVVAWECFSLPPRDPLLYSLQNPVKLGIVVHVYNPSDCKAEARGSWIWGQHRICSKTLSQKELASQPTNQPNKQKPQTYKNVTSSASSWLLCREWHSLQGFQTILFLCPHCTYHTILSLSV